MLPRRLLLLALALTLAAPALASEGDPQSVIRELYRVHGEQEKTKQQAWQPPHRERFFTRDLAGLIAEAEKRNAIDFDFIYDGQDFKISDLEFSVKRGSGLTARVEVRFKNFGKPNRLLYDLVQEGGAWRISNVRTGRATQGWMLVQLLRKK
jgi:hypothetical protein